ncbi:hypothetical protein VTK73DRAFT_2964 [Phialemonium thermophilum]|uniref:NTF2 domain-containing protein n=1 Tax=Phialemonium thermophilum TaxID=223376 RepID=A0ABR3X1G7_9PEZI
MAVARENQVKAASEAASNFIEWYYKALRDGSPIGPFYVTNNSKYAAASTTSDISVNGAVLTGGPAEYEKLLEQQRTTPSGIVPASRVHYDVESWDVHVLNPNFVIACPPELLNPGQQRHDKDVDSRSSLLLQVTGQITYSAEKDPNPIKRPFNETFVLVPNWDALRRNAPRNMRKKLILSQNFRSL